MARTAVAAVLSFFWLMSCPAAYSQNSGAGGTGPGCASGKVPFPDGSCPLAPPEQTPPEQTCPKGQIAVQLDAGSSFCISAASTCPPNSELQNGACVVIAPACPAGQKIQDGKCVSKNVTSSQCEGWEEAKDGQCIAKPGQCPPWQEFKNGTCVVKALSPTLSTGTCDGGTAGLGGQCVCPAGKILNPSTGNCFAPIKIPGKGGGGISCQGGSVVDGACQCPSGFPNFNPSLGMCMRTDAGNCVGGSLNDEGTCYCIGNPGGYAKELVNGKCVAKQCPKFTSLKNGECVGQPDLACHTGYIPDKANPTTSDGGVHCIPNPHLCAWSLKDKNGNCPKSALIAMTCHQGQGCKCNGALAVWVAGTCQCKAPFKNLGGKCAQATVAPGPKGGKKSSEKEKNKHTMTVVPASGNKKSGANGTSAPALLLPASEAGSSLYRTRVPSPPSPSTTISPTRVPSPIQTFRRGIVTAPAGKKD